MACGATCLTVKVTADLVPSVLYAIERSDAEAGELSWSSDWPCERYLDYKRLLMASVVYVSAMVVAKYFWANVIPDVEVEATSAYFVAYSGSVAVIECGSPALWAVNANMTLSA